MTKSNTGSKGAIIGTGIVCAFLEIALSFMPPKWLQLVFPPIVTGPTVMLIGVQLIASGFQDWAGGNGACAAMPTSGMFSMCPSTAAPHPLPWGSPEFIGEPQIYHNTTLHAITDL